MPSSRLPQITAMRRSVTVRRRPWSVKATEIVG
jgi:hypothetical protein